MRFGRESKIFHSSIYYNMYNTRACGSQESGRRANYTCAYSTLSVITHRQRNNNVYRAKCVCVRVQLSGKKIYNNDTHAQYSLSAAESLVFRTDEKKKKNRSIVYFFRSSFYFRQRAWLSFTRDYYLISPFLIERSCAEKCALYGRRRRRIINSRSMTCSRFTIYYKRRYYNHKS